MILKLTISQKAQSNKKPCKTNLRGPIRVWVPKNEIVFAADTLKRKAKQQLLFEDNGCLKLTIRRKPTFQTLTLKEEGNLES